MQAGVFGFACHLPFCWFTIFHVSQSILLSWVPPPAPPLNKHTHKFLESNYLPGQKTKQNRKKFLCGKFTRPLSTCHCFHFLFLKDRLAVRVLSGRQAWPSARWGSYPTVTSRFLLSLLTRHLPLVSRSFHHRPRAPVPGTFTAASLDVDFFPLFCLEYGRLPEPVDLYFCHV